MQGVFLRLFTAESAKHGSKLQYEWILDQARDLGFGGGSVFRSIAGFGRHGRVHEEHFFELAGELPLCMEFFADAALVDQLLEQLRSQGISLFYVRFAADAGLTSKP